MSPRTSRLQLWLITRRWALGFLGWSALAFTVAHWDHDENRRLDGAPTTIAEITGIDRWTKGGPDLELLIELPDGRTVTGRTNNFYDIPRRGNGVWILVQYAVDGSDVYVREAGRGPDHTGTWGWSIAGTGAALTGVIMLLVRSRRSRRTRVDQQGDSVEDGV